MKSIAGDAVKIKTAGGIRDWNTCKEMIDAGASRIGTSSSFKILEEYEHRWLKLPKKSKAIYNLTSWKSSNVCRRSTCDS